MSACHRSSYPRTMTCLRGKFFLAGACSSFTNCRLSKLCCFFASLVFLDNRLFLLLALSLISVYRPSIAVLNPFVVVLNPFVAVLESFLIRSYPFFTRSLCSACVFDPFFTRSLCSARVLDPFLTRSLRSARVSDPFLTSFLVFRSRFCSVFVFC